jgi:thioesterase domain-containing protein/acyl carrier protein
MGRYLADGCLEFLGRVDFQVKIQGHRIELGEIESTLIAHPQVKEVAVVASDADANGTRQLAGYVVLTQENAVTVADLQEFLRRSLPTYMVPTSWLLLESLPMTGNGKIDRKALIDMDAEGISDGQGRCREYVAPRGDVEEKLVQIWKDVLKLDDIGIEDDFFDIGGQSFDCVRIFAIVKEEFGQAFSLGDIWTLRTIAKLAARLHPEAAAAAGGRLVPIEIAREGHPLFLVHPAGGHCTGYRELARLLDFPVYGFQAEATEDSGEATPSLGDVAQVYVAELREVQPEGPYFLGGWSTGAMIAFEMAVQLENAGQDVRQVILLDGPTPVPHEDLSDGSLLRWFIEDLALDLPLEVLQNVDFSQLSLADQLRKSTDLFGGADELGLDIAQLLPVYRIFRDLVVAGSAYQPAKIRAHLLVVRVEENIVSEFADHRHQGRDDWGWGLHTSGHVDCAVVPGNHHTFLTSFAAEKVAQRITADR